MIFDELPGAVQQKDVAVPTDPEWKYSVNVMMQSISILLYSVLLVYLLHNTYKYLVVAKRY